MIHCPANGPRLIPGYSNEDRRKPPMPPKRKPLQTAPSPGDEAVEAIYAVIRRIPKGWVATYGQVAAMAGLPRRARLVGYVLQHLDPTTRIPWHRVVNAKGEISYSLSRNGGDALHQFDRASYGTPQSLGYVEMPLEEAAQVYPYTPIGTLVTIAG